MACSKAYLSILTKNENDLIYSKILLNKAQSFIDKLTNHNASMPICELWIELSTIYGVVKEQTKQTYCLAQAENNKYWKDCANHYKIPLSNETIVLGEFPNFTIQNLTYNQIYTQIQDNEMSILGNQKDSCVIS